VVEVDRDDPIEGAEVPREVAIRHPEEKKRCEPRQF